ncbi:MAG TPA: MoxR family ATPase [Chloroflexota bacterium]|jgi:MoxR-like ATPase|uniref:MoxR family ATPase n=1 Tax=Thermorudis sp. TaxID=1969470 RepID=A0A7C3A7P9_9BACT
MSVVRSVQSPEEFIATARAIEEEIGKVIVGQEEVVRGVLIAILAGGHALIEGVPGLGKTMLVRTLGEVLDLRLSRIQFTPDLMPADITGTQLIAELPDGSRSFRFQPGPIFANLILADEINRATPKTQSALLEAMQELRVTAGRETYPLERPFFVLATQNPIEMEGTYPLPEAQLDRFLFKLQVSYPSLDDLLLIAERTTSRRSPTVRRVADRATVLEMIDFARDIPIAQPVVRYAAELTLRTHPEHPESLPMVKRFVRYGASPRGMQAMVLGGKVRALLEGRYNVAFEDVRAVAPMALRHRILLNFQADAEGVTADRIVAEVVSSTPED